MREKKAPPGFLEARIRSGRYFFPGPGRSDHGIQVVGAGWEDCLPDFRIDRPHFRYQAIELIDSGDWLVRAGRGPARRVGAGGVFLYGPGSPCTVQAAGPGPHGKYFLDIEGGGAAALLRQAGLRGGMVFGNAGQGSLAALFEQLIACSNLTKRRAEPLSLLLARCIYLRAGAERCATSAPPANGTFERCKRFLEARYASLGGIAEAARDCHVSPAHFSRLFRRFAGTSAERYLKKLRLNQAARLLQQSGSPLKEIALQSGFKDPYHFSKVFKSAHGVPPSVFRRRSGRGGK